MKIERNHGTQKNHKKDYASPKSLTYYSITIELCMINTLYTNNSFFPSNKLSSP